MFIVGNEIMSTNNTVIPIDIFANKLAENMGKQLICVGSCHNACSQKHPGQLDSSELSHCHKQSKSCN